MRIIVSAGGTGGHIYPALTIINKIKSENKDVEILYIGTHNRMEKDLIPNQGINYKSLKIEGINKKISFDIFKKIYYIIKAEKDAKKIIKDFKPDIVLGFGGYVTYPVIKAAHSLKIKTFIHEQNSFAGLSNKKTGRFADKVAVSFTSTLKDFDPEKTVLTGNPSGDRILDAKKAPKKTYGLSDNKKLVLIVMGSLGSKTVNEKFKEILKMFDKVSYEVVFITGNNYYDRMKDIKVSDNVKIMPYIDNIAPFMKNVDIMVSRAGASTMTEIIALKLPTIFIPSPYVANNHQYYNAMNLVEKEAGLILEEKDLDGKLLLEKIDFLLNNPKEYSKVQKNLEAFEIKNSTDKIYQIIIEMVDEKHGKNN